MKGIDPKSQSPEAAFDLDGYSMSQKDALCSGKASQAFSHANPTA